MMRSIYLPVAMLGIAALVQVGCAQTQSQPQPQSQSVSVSSVKDSGAVGDGKTNDTKAFQAALDGCARSGGGTVTVPAGNYLIGSLVLGPNTTLNLEKDSNLLGSADPDDYPLIDVRWEGNWVKGHRGLIYANHADHIAIVGPGHKDL